MYDRFQENRRIESSVSYTARLEEKRTIAKSMIDNNEQDDKIMLYTGLSLEQIAQLRGEGA